MWGKNTFSFNIQHTGSKFQPPIPPPPPICLFLQRQVLGRCNVTTDIRARGYQILEYISNFAIEEPEDKKSLLSWDTDAMERCAGKFHRRGHNGIFF